MFTSNQVVAAPIIIGRQHMHASHGRIRALIVNAGNANCATGQAGLDACTQVCNNAAALFNWLPQRADHPILDRHHRRAASIRQIDRRTPALHQGLGATPEHFGQFATAIMTTDTRMKVAHASCTIAGKTVRILGTTKGAGMIQPKLVAPHATMLAYLFTDAAIEPAAMNDLLHKAVNASFNRISIDGDTSTNDTVLLMASGKSNAAVATPDATENFQKALTEVCTSLAKQMVADGEGCRACRRTAGLRRAHRRRRLAHSTLHRQLAARQNGMGRYRSELGTHPGRNRLCWRSH